MSFGGNFGVCESWLSMMVAGQPGDRWLQKRSSRLAELPKRTERLRGCCTAAWGSELTVRARGHQPETPFPGRGHKHCLHRARPGKGRWEGLGLMWDKPRGSKPGLPVTAAVSPNILNKGQRVYCETWQKPQREEVSRFVDSKNTRIQLVSGIPGLHYSNA